MSIMDLDLNSSYSDCSRVIRDMAKGLMNNIKPNYHELERMEYLLTKFSSNDLSAIEYNNLIHIICIVCPML